METFGICYNTEQLTSLFSIPDVIYLKLMCDFRFGYTPFSTVNNPLSDTFHIYFMRKDTEEDYEKILTRMKLFSNQVIILQHFTLTMSFSHHFIVTIHYVCLYKTLHCMYVINTNMI